MSIGYTKDCFFCQLYGCPKTKFDRQWYAKQKQRAHAQNGSPT